MNKVVFLLVWLFTVGAARATFAQDVCGLTLYTQDGEPFRLYANGNLVNPKPATRVLVRELYTDMVNIKVDFVKPALGSITKTMYLRMGSEERHVIKKKQARTSTETAGAGLEEKLLGALGQDTHETTTSPYTIVFDHAVPYRPEVETNFDVDRTTTVRAGGQTVTTHTRTKTRIRQRIR